MRSLLLVCLLVFCSCNFSTEESELTPKNSQDNLPHDFMFMQRAYPTGEIKTDAYANAIAWKKNQVSTRSSGLLWEFSGPVNTGGRITDIEIPIDQAQTYYVGAASGGIFKTTDAGATWAPIFDDQAALSIGDMEISKNDTDIIWVGTGEVNAGGGSLAYDGDGIYRSGDGGLTWETKGLPDVGSIGKILIDPNDENTVFVGAMGPLFRDDTNRGVYRTTDGGDNWEQVLFVSDITGVIDMAIHPTNGDIVYATSWERVRRPQFRDYGGETSRIYRSTDGGDTWSELTNGLPSNPSDKGRISIDIASSNPNVLYARYANAAGSIQGVYRTADGGDTWVEVNSSQLTNVGFHWWFRGIFIDPNDENTIYNVDFIVEKSTDGGNSWFTAFPNVHVDQHAMAFNMMTGGEVLLGNDGGFYKSPDDGASYTKDLTLPITQFYRFHVDAQNGDKVYGGTQDNNTIRTVTGGLNDWNPIFGGDGFQPLVDPTNTNVIYALSQNGNLGKSIDDGQSFTNLGAPGARKNWNSPILLDPADSETLYFAANQLYKSEDGGDNWNAISGDLTNGSGGGNLTFGTIYSFDVSTLDSNIIYVGTDDGNVWETEDGGTNWNNISSTLPDRWVTKVLADRFDPNTVYVTFSGYRYGEDNGHVYRSNNKGANWDLVGTDLPDIPVNDIVQDANGNLYLATDIGVFASGTNGGSWEVLGSNLPSVVVTDMHIHEADQLLYAATYGRSSYKMDISSIVLGTNDSEFDAAVSVYPNPAVDVVNIDMGQVSNKFEIEIYNTMGQKMSANLVQNKSRTSIDVSSLSTGIYYVRISEGKQDTTKKLIIK
ncbi:MAG: T9SS type A sorting domain-containing protein [Flavobacteriaceae bacterium]|nr:T9SS type A sorting domain-containing protein [Flavobacteriaceae bacterium]